MAFVLEGLADGRRVRFPLDAGRTRVGRAPRNELVLAQAEVSREHAEITTSEGGVDIRDLGSTNGTYVDDDRVFDTVDLHVGQTIRFASVEFALVEDTSDDRPASPDRPAFSPAGSTASRWPGSPGEPGEIGEAIIQEETDVDWLSAIAGAGRLLVLANTPVDAVDEICDLIRKVVPWQRAVVLVCDTVQGSTEVFVLRDHGQPTSARLLLGEESWELLLRDRLPLIIESAAGPDQARAEPAARPDQAQAEPAAGAGQAQAELAVVAGRERDKPAAAALTHLQALVIPLQVRSRAFGCLYLETPASAVSWPSARSEALLVLADLLSVRLSQARLTRTLRDQERLEREVAMAAGVQRSLLRNLRFDRAGYEALARQIPCYEVGGDLYDISVMADGSVMLVLGDVSGKGDGSGDAHVPRGGGAARPLRGRAGACRVDGPPASPAPCFHGTDTVRHDVPRCLASRREHVGIRERRALPAHSDGSRRSRERSDRHQPAPRAPACSFVQGGDGHDTGRGGSLRVFGWGVGGGDCRRILR